MKTCVLIPAHNESQTIGCLIEQIKKLYLDVLVIDDGSTDATMAIARQMGAEVFRNPVNQGKGAALVQGFEYIKTNLFDAVITMDADGQHLPEDIPSFLEQAARSTSGIIIGNRMDRPKNMPFVRVVTNRFMSWLISRVCRQSIADSQCGFRLIKKEVLDKITFTTHRFELESEMLIEASHAGFTISSVPIHTVYSNERSHINPFSDTLRFFKFICTKKPLSK